MLAAALVAVSLLCPAESIHHRRPPRSRPVLYTAVVRDQVILSEFELPALLDLLADIQAADEDVVVWRGPRAVAVRLGTGHVIAIDAAPLAAA